MVSALNVVSNLFVSPNPDCHAKMLIGPHLKKTYLQVLLSGMEMKTKPSPEKRVSSASGLMKVLRAFSE